MASIGVDGKIVIYDIENEIIPVGFIDIGGNVQNIVWEQDLHKAVDGISLYILLHPVDSHCSHIHRLKFPLNDPVAIDSSFQIDIAQLNHQIYIVDEKLYDFFLMPRFIYSDIVN